MVLEVRHDAPPIQTRKERLLVRHIVPGLQLLLGSQAVDAHLHELVHGVLEPGRRRVERGVAAGSRRAPRAAPGAGPALKVTVNGCTLITPG